MKHEPQPSRSLTRRTLLKGGIGVAAASLAGSRSVRAARERPPNILFILADDLGYADLSCYGRRDYRTEHLDKLAAEGLQLMHAYANSPICSPTRVGLITGRYQYRLPIGLEEPLSSRNTKLGLPGSHPTLPSLLKAHGYRTSLIGKWHLGEPPQFGPLLSGYESFFGIVSGGTDYFTHELVFDREVVGGKLHEGAVPVERVGYITDLLAQRAIEQIASAGTAPFFMSLHFTAPHWPWEGPQDEAVAKTLADSRHRDGGSLATFAQMVRSLDSNVGRVLAALQAAGLAENTIVIFTSDNGGERFSDVWPFVGAKGELLEGGIRVPLIVRWPHRIGAGTRSNQVLVSMDWLPTLLAAAGTAPDPEHPSDGVNLLPVLLNEASVRDRKLFWRFKAAGQAAVRSGRWKYLRLADREYLFDIVADPRERADLKARQPQLFAQLRDEFAAWDKTMLPYPQESQSEAAKRNLSDRY
jgi:arylsulfatase A-like enzyme